MDRRPFSAAVLKNVLLDVRNAEPFGNGRRCAPIIDWRESVRLYGTGA